MMKTAKLIIGIVSIVLTFLILFQSCAASLGDALANEGGTSGGAGMIVAVLMLISGIVAIATRKSKGGGIFCLVLYALAGTIGITSSGMFQDLILWGVLCLVFAAVFLISAMTSKKSSTSDSAEQ